MRLARFSLLFAALAFGGFGGWLLIAPHAISLVGVELTSPSAVAEVRAYYGGLEVGMALFFVLAIRRSSWWMPALTVQAATMGGAAAGRVIGILVDGATGGLILLIAAAEAAGALLGAAALLRLRSRGE